MTTTEYIKKELLRGHKINKFGLMNKTGSVCLAQRILDLKNEGWDIRGRSVKGKGSLREYYLEKAEIERLKNGSVS